MFTGIIEHLGLVKALRTEGSNLHIDMASSLVPALHVDQSIAHNGVCLTVAALSEAYYTVTAIEETLQKSNLGFLKVGDLVNLERSMTMQKRLDGHLVQGHVDQIGTCLEIENRDGSWVFHFAYDPQKGNLTVEKGSICINGVSLTVVHSSLGQFSVAIIPYTYTHTNFEQLQVGDKVNLEFDIIGKYVQRIMAPFMAQIKP
ncbi:MAG: riboflavin synthase [Microscillaceae bacterium]|nr:riboflavin synthase [Microscillaceae bacterium]